MRNSLLISTLIISLALTSTIHAASGDITVGTRTYTAVQAESQIVAPLLARLSRQKVAKTKLRLTNLAIRQYTLKQKSAQKQGKIELAQFYATIVTRLTNMQKLLPVSQTGSTVSVVTSSTITNTQNTPINSSGSVVNNGNTVNSGTAGSYNGTSGMTQDQITQRITENNIFTAYSGNGGANQSRSVFISWVISDIGGPNTYAVQYANTLVFKQS